MKEHRLSSRSGAHGSVRGRAQIRGVLASSLIVLLAGVVFLGALCSAQGADSQCREERQFSGADYWYWEGYLGIKVVREQAGERFGRLTNDPGICFRVLVSEINDPMSRTKGFKAAGQELVHLLYRGRTEWNSGSAVAARNRFKSLTGHNFESFAELQSWWQENNDYLVWSEAEKRLVINEAAKSARRPIAPLHPVENVPAERYWFFEGMGWLKDVKDEGSQLSARAWTGDREVKIRVDKTSLEDRASKQKGYWQALKTIVEDRLRLAELGEASARELIQRLQAMTGERFSDRGSWIQWWNDNRDSLVLSMDGQRLVVGKRPH